MEKCLIFMVIILLAGTIWGNEISSNELSSEELPKKIPMKAAALSIIPGGGQIYNDSYLKAGIVIGLEAGLIGLAIYHNEKYQDSKEKYKLSDSALDYSDYVYYYEQRQSDYFWIGTVVFLSIIDAYVDAHLYDFESKKKKIDLKFENKALLISYNF